MENAKIQKLYCDTLSNFLVKRRLVHKNLMNFSFRK